MGTNRDETDTRGSRAGELMLFNSFIFILFFAIVLALHSPPLPLHLRAGGIATTAIMVPGPTVDIIFEAHKRGAELIVIGSHGQGRCSSYSSAASRKESCVKRRFRCSWYRPGASMTSNKTPGIAQIPAPNCDTHWTNVVSPKHVK